MNTRRLRRIAQSIRALVLGGLTVCAACDLSGNDVDPDLLGGWVQYQWSGCTYRLEFSDDRTYAERAWCPNSGEEAVTGRYSVDKAAVTLEDGTRLVYSVSRDLRELTVYDHGVPSSRFARDSWPDDSRHSPTWQPDRSR